jgi:hypothetical protein
MTSKKKTSNRRYALGSGGQTELKGCAVLAAVIIGIVIIAILADWTIGKGSVSREIATTSQLPPKKVTASELFDAYQASTAAAQHAYGEQRLQVSGVVAGIDSDFADNAMVLLQTSSPVMNTRAKLADARSPRVSALRKGQSIVLMCQDVFEVAGTPMLSDCNIL